MDTTTIAYIGVFVGVFLRTLLPYIRKLKEAQGKNEELGFDVKYVATAVFSFIVSFIVASLIFPSFVVPDVLDLYIFLQAFAFGWATNDVINEVIS